MTPEELIAAIRRLEQAALDVGCEWEIGYTVVDGFHVQAEEYRFLHKPILLGATEDDARITILVSAKCDHTPSWPVDVDALAESLKGPGHE